MARECRELTTDEAWDDAVSLLAQLWTDTVESTILSWRDDPEYHLLGRFVDDDLVAVAGVSVQRVLHHTRHAWIHDFVVDQPRRSRGHGASLLAYVDEWARERDCTHLALAARLENEDALDFYEAQGMERWGYVVEREL